MHHLRGLKVIYYRDPSEFEIHLSELMIKCLLLAMDELLPSTFQIRPSCETKSCKWREMNAPCFHKVKFSCLQHLSRKVNNSPNTYSANSTSQQHTPDVSHKKCKKCWVFTFKRFMGTKEKRTKARALSGATHFTEVITVKQILNSLFFSSYSFFLINNVHPAWCAALLLCQHDFGFYALQNSSEVL